MKMDYIEDKDLYSAVNFACSMIRKGQAPGLANKIAANYYHVDIHDVAKYVGQRSHKGKK